MLIFFIFNNTRSRAWHEMPKRKAAVAIPFTRPTNTLVGKKKKKGKGKREREGKKKSATETRIGLPT